MGLAVEPPLAPMLAKLARELPEGEDWRYEPKWDGFRCLAFRDGDRVDLRSRHDRLLAAYFPEVVSALRRLDAAKVVVDGELIVESDGEADFATLLSRIHPAASRVAQLSATHPACYVVFDVLVRDDETLLARTYDERRAVVDAVLHEAPAGLRSTPVTLDPEVARLWLDHAGRGIDGVVAKRGRDAYAPGRRSMVKVKLERTVDCVVAGCRVFADRPVVSSLMLGLYDDTGRLHHVGAATAFSAAARRVLATTLRPLVTDLRGHPWEQGFGLEGGSTGRLKGSVGRWTPDQPQDWVPVRPDLVCEVAFDQVDAGRMRHAARFRRWRPDRDPGSCHLEQLVPS